MVISELFEDTVEPFEKGLHDEKDDQSVLSLSDIRKTRLTLAHLNRVRILNDIKKLEHSKKLVSLAAQYKPAAPQGM